MSWSGTWVGNVYIGAHNVDENGRVFMGAWTKIQAPAGHPFFEGPPPDDSLAHQRPWLGIWRDNVWRGKYTDPEGGFEFAGTMNEAG